MSIMKCEGDVKGTSEALQRGIPNKATSSEEGAMNFHSRLKTWRKDPEDLVDRIARQDRYVLMVAAFHRSSG